MTELVKKADDLEEEVVSWKNKLEERSVLAESVEADCKQVFFIV